MFRTDAPTSSERLPRAVRAGWRGGVGAAVAICFVLAAFAGLPTLSAEGDDASGGEPIAAIALPAGLDANRVELGRQLFHDVRLSGDASVACASCHDLGRGGDDGHARGTGKDGKPLDFNAPTVFNAALNFRLNWRGNFGDLERQNEAALLDPRLMGASWEALIPRLRAAPEYDRGFRSAYGRTATREDVLDALAAFQRSLVTPGAPFDRYLGGDAAALTPAERHGYELFKSYGCSSCHQGRNVGGNLFQRFGVFANPFAKGESGTDADLGRFTVTGLEADRHVFRVPSLRNVGVTAPYLHDGSAATLDEVVAIMGRSQLGIELPDQDIDSIVEFLHTLTGEYQGRSLASGAGAS